jgi:hypothetical protein
MPGKFDLAQWLLIRKTYQQQYILLTYLHDYLPSCIVFIHWIGYSKSLSTVGKDLDRKVGCSKVKDQIGVDIR